MGIYEYESNEVRARKNHLYAKLAYCRRPAVYEYPPVIRSQRKSSSENTKYAFVWYHPSECKVARQTPR